MAKQRRKEGQIKSVDSGVEDERKVVRQCLLQGPQSKLINIKTYVSLFIYQLPSGQDQLATRNRHNPFGKLHAMGRHGGLVFLSSW